ncbi:response regulator [Quisquiliibacterium transsilvanicum]|uniref:CheY-like chemotaxis protein n=1 Tax=Quisquiliibacterium transsilvanicum TaxID=1549638 RepID=A0A7W8HKP5_9BURK|nr:CheY-like chemotaxis protein [Quisquiliibacterium transsilvanicum]
MKNILLVDDDEDQLALMRLVLAREFPGIDVLAVSSGNQALEALDAAAQAPVLMMVDVKMPGMDGPATVRRIRERSRWAGCPIVMMSTSETPEDISASLEAGADIYLRKPLTLDDWARTLHGVANYWSHPGSPPDGGAHVVA